MITSPPEYIIEKTIRGYSVCIYDPISGGDYSHFYIGYNEGIQKLKWKLQQELNAATAWWERNVLNGNK
jgi:hypothetical protein